MPEISCGDRHGIADVIYRPTQYSQLFIDKCKKTVVYLQLITAKRYIENAKTMNGDIA